MSKLDNTAEPLPANGQVLSLVPIVGNPGFGALRCLVSVHVVLALVCLRVLRHNVRKSKCCSSSSAQYFSCSFMRCVFNSFLVMVVAGDQGPPAGGRSVRRGPVPGGGDHGAHGDG